MITPYEALKTHIKQHVIGQESLIERLLIGVLTGGHLLIEGLPGLAKTTAVHALASGTAMSFQRIQFTPDLIPGDITGSDIYLPENGRFQFMPGPLFHDIILADEINRAPPKVQSALLEAMQEHQVTSGGITHELSPAFMVVATQNPIEQEGTYLLPEAQLDRFLMKINVDYPNAEDELKILQQHQQQKPTPNDIEYALTQEQLLDSRRAVNNIYIDEMLERSIVTLVAATRKLGDWFPEQDNWLSRGASPRASLALAHASRARAYLNERDFVEPDDIMALTHDILQHRISLSYAAHAKQLTPRKIINMIVDTVPVP